MCSATFGILGRRFELALGGGHDGIRTGIDSLIEVAALQIRPHDLPDDPAGGYVGQCPLKAHADLYAHLALGLGYDQQHPVVLTLLAQFPLFCHPDGKLVYVVTLQRGECQYSNLVRCFPLEPGQLLLKPGRCFR